MFTGSFLFTKFIFSSVKTLAILSTLIMGPLLSVWPLDLAHVNNFIPTETSGILVCFINNVPLFTKSVVLS